MPTRAFTISKLAAAAGIGVEAVRFYQRRGLLQAPERAGGGFREYTQADVRRLQFIKRAQQLGFSLADVAELTALNAAEDRLRARAVAQRRLEDVSQRMAHLGALAEVLQGLMGCCERSALTEDCPIIGALAGKPSPEPKVLRGNTTVNGRGRSDGTASEAGGA